jgi:ribosomal protein S18 acetylase RimI-like enzyme
MLVVDQLSPDSAGIDDFYRLGELVNTDPAAVRPKRDSVAASIRRARFSDRLWIGMARRDGQPAARVVARLSPDLNDEAGRPLGLLGTFEARDDREAVAQLFDAAVAWLRTAGAATIIGPIDGDTWHRYRFNVGPWDEPPFLMEPHQPAYYAPLWEAYGFQELEGYYSKRVDDCFSASAKLEPVRARVESQGYRLRTYRPERYEDELRLLYDLSLAIFAGNYLYSPIDWEEFRKLYDPVRRLIVPELLWFAYAPDGTPAGFLFGTVDWQEAAARASRRSGLAAKLAFLWNKRRARAVNLKSLGVVARYRRSGLGAALMYEGYRVTFSRGYRRANLCLIRDGNPSGDLDGGLGQVMRRYVLYHLPESRA